MQLSTRGRYGLRAAVELAQNSGAGPVRLRDLAEHQGVSVKYLHSLMASLKRSGLVRSVRGAGGGYELTRPPSHIRVSEVVHVLEGSLGLVGCVEDKSFCGRVDRCPVRSVWVDLSKTVENALSGMTLQDIVARASESNATPATYNI